MEQEKKLAEYRARKKREQQIKHYKENIKSLFKWKHEEPPVVDSENENMLDNEPETVSEDDVISSCGEDIVSTSQSIETPPPSAIRMEFYLLFGILWLGTFILFIKLEFGTIYLIISALFGIYLNTRTGPKNKNEVSAYSVFNENCKSIDGTLKAEQFEREIRFGSMTVH